MATQLPVKAIKSGATTTALSEFDPGDTVAIEQGGTGQSTLGDAKAILGVTAVENGLSNHVAAINNPHAVTKNQVGLGNADNTSDANKPVSTATQAALNAKAPIASPVFTGTVTSGSGYVWSGSVGFGLSATSYAAEDGLRANYIFDAGHGYTSQLTTYHNPGVSAFFQMKVGTNIFRFLDDGSAQKLGGGAWTAVSDARTKNNIEDWTTGLETVLGLRIRQWTYKAETGLNSNVKHRGLLGQEAEFIAPTLVKTQKGSVGTLEFDDLRSVDPSDLPYILVNAVQDMYAELTAAKARITALEDKLSKLVE